MSSKDMALIIESSVVDVVDDELIPPHVRMFLDLA